MVIVSCVLHADGHVKVQRELLTTLIIVLTPLLISSNLKTNIIW